jgi:hypothetical protein
LVEATADNRRIVAAADDLRRLVNGYQTAQALYVAATLGIADLLAGGPRTSDELAAATETHADSLYRLLRALAAAGVFEEQPGRTFASTPLGEGLRTDAPQSLNAWAAMIGRPYHWHTWAGLLHSVRTGENAFRSLHGQSVWEYRAERPEESALFDDAMTSVTRAVDGAIVAGYDFGRFAHIVDVGGGHGSFLAAVLDRHRSATGTLFDQEHVVDGAPHIERCLVVAGSFFDTVPSGGDAYVLKSVVHDWPDDDAVAILRTTAAALDGDARVLLVERDLADPGSAWVDLQMLVMVGGRERTEDEYAALFRAAGLEPAGTTKVGAGFAVFEARRAPASTMAP